ncbi:MAG: CopG family transcriptional regulator [Deltaproteobacteria bacterium]|nr:CopG family transcriptional regulator [Deltaproteobacteria bacterium]
MRTAKVISISLPPEMEKEIQEIARDERRTISELFREAIRQYATQKVLQSARKAGRSYMRKAGMRPANITRMIKDDRRRRK